MAAPAPLRPARQARSRATRRRLLAASVGALRELGYAGTTTTEVARRAGVSQGAVYKHFPSKLQLLTAGIRHLFVELVEEFRAAFETGDHSPAEAVRLLQQSFAQPRLLAAFELYTAARTDPSLRDELAPILAEHRENLRREARRLFPRPPTEGIEPLVDTLISALQGAALGGLVAPDPEAERRSLALLTRWVEQELQRV